MTPRTKLPPPEAELMKKVVEYVRGDRDHTACQVARRMMESSAWPKVPEPTRESLLWYVVAGRRTSDFLTNVLANDLRRTIGHADHRNEAALGDIVTLVNSAAPAPCWGSRERVREWDGLYQRDV